MKRVGLAIALGAVLVGCDKAPEIDKRLYPDTAGDPAVVDIASNGSEPRTLLRLTPTVGEVQRGALRMKMSGSMIPTVDMSMDLESKVTGLNGDGSFAMEQAITDASMNIPGSGDVGEMIEGMRITQTMTARGDIQSGNIEGGVAELGAMLDESFEGVQFSLPEGEVGPGGKWTVRTLETENGFEVYQTITYTVKKLEGKVLHLDLGLDQRAKDQTISAGFQTATLDYLHTEGSGKMELDLTKPLPVSMNLSGTMKMKISMGGESEKANIDLNISLAAL
jgi:hypothetical protein